ncbi:hypothetical protein LSTR_LSTR007194 [Laodelphax striatellus]|uniref:Uncharacterized protein n=1 Tax=Laodelphax striatellus TaxID=195883 RepID=A0A482WSZ5_LAOST|nr:hypothetical protein LSTR_LSTR007194 [Laodelphax striatellus]
MRNTEGPKTSKRRLIASTVGSAVLYAAPVWEGALKFQRTSLILGRIGRRLAMRITAAYRTISKDAAHVIAGTPPWIFVPRSLPGSTMACPGKRLKRWSGRSGSSCGTPSQTGRGHTQPHPWS